MAVEITSLKNPRILLIQSLQNARERRSTGLFVVEGMREISLLQQAGFDITTMVVCAPVYREDPFYPIDLNAPEILDISEQVFAKLSYRGGTGGILAVASMKSENLSNWKPAGKATYLILEHIEKPGNLGAMLRTADAAGVTGVIIADPATDLFNPNVVRSSIGCLFTVPVSLASNDEIVGWCRKCSVRTYTAVVEAKTVYSDAHFGEKSAIVLGAESTGLSDFWKKYGDEQLSIPMRGKIDSLNVSTSAAILLFEATRGRPA